MSRLHTEWKRYPFGWHSGSHVTQWKLEVKPSHGQQAIRVNEGEMAQHLVDGDMRCSHRIPHTPRIAPFTSFRNFLAGFQWPFSMSVHPQWGPSEPSFPSPAGPHSPEFSALLLTFLSVAHPHQDVQHLSCVFLLKHFSESFSLHNGKAVLASRQMIGGSNKPQRQQHKDPS